uniref:Uncharacterized protein n=1 Tax=Oryza brachyantha TaxID=4533 RepID=J3N8X8_ORYBR
MGLPFVCAFSWGRPYLTREFFHRLGEKMGDKVMLIVAEHDDKLVAGALNRIGGDTLFVAYGDVCQMLISPTCILKLAIISCRYFLNPGFGIAIGHYLAHETAQVRISWQHNIIIKQTKLLPAQLRG